MGELLVPAGVERMTLRDAAVAYAEAGLYVLPIAHKTRHAGSRLGKGWPAKSSRDPDLVAWWFGRCATYGHEPGGGIAIHVGRSGLVAFDVDAPENMPGVLTDALLESTTAYQSTRPAQPLRGHWVYSTDRTFGNGLGALRAEHGGQVCDHEPRCSWGDVRGKNGIVLAAPTPHPGGHRYRWRTREILPLPDVLAEALEPPPRQRSPFVSLDPFAAVNGPLAYALDAGDGHWNDALFWASSVLGEMVRDGAISEKQARQMLTEVALATGQDYDLKTNRPTTTYLGTIDSGLRAGMTS